MTEDVIDPADTRRVSVAGLEQARDKKVDRPRESTAHSGLSGHRRQRLVNDAIGSEDGP